MGIKAGLAGVFLATLRCRCISTIVYSGNHTVGGTGGGLDVYQLYGNHLLFENNSVVNSGGGISMAFGTLDNSRFINNTSQNTTSVDAGGGAVFVNNSLTASNLLFERNNGLRGAALYVKGGVVLKHATIARPTRGTGRAIYVKSGATLDIKNSIFTAYEVGIYNDGTLTEDYNLGFDMEQTLPTAAQLTVECIVLWPTRCLNPRLEVITGCSAPHQRSEMAPTWV